jgi:hypothetical protein
MCVFSRISADVCVFENFCRACFKKASLVKRAREREKYTGVGAVPASMEAPGDDLDFNDLVKHISIEFVWAYFFNFDNVQG